MDALHGGIPATTPLAVGPEPAARSRAKIWLRRYLPCEIVGTVAELGGAGGAYVATGSLAAAAIAGTVGAAVGYYAIAYWTAMRMALREAGTRPLPSRWFVANLLALRSVTVEFGPGEAIDSLAVRPLTYYFAPILLGSTVGGFIAAKVISDVVFYLCAITSFERCGSIVLRSPSDPSDQRDTP